MEIFANIASIASIVSLGVALVQTLRVRNMRAEQQRHLWSLIASSKALVRHLERQDLHQAYGLASEHFRQLLRDAIAIEKQFTVETIKAWRNAGKLSSDWQERQAYMLLSTKEISRSKDKGFPAALANIDNPAPGHPIAKQWVNQPPEHKEIPTSSLPHQEPQAQGESATALTQDPEPPAADHDSPPSPSTPPS